MKIAICMYGYPNYFFENLNNHQTFFENLDIDYYCHFWYLPANRNLEKERNIKNCLKHSEIIFEEQKNFNINFDFYVDTAKTNKSVPHTISPLYSMKRCAEILDNAVNNKNKKYDYVVATRPDIACLDLKFYQEIKEKDIIYSSYVPGDMWVPHETGFAIDNKFICSSYESMSYFLKIYDYYENYMKYDKIPLCHHRLSYHHLKKLNKNFKTLFSDQWYFYREYGLSRG